MPPSFTISPHDGTDSPGDEESDPFDDPPTFQADISPFVAADNHRGTSPVFPHMEDASYSPVEPQNPTDFNPSRATGNGNQRSSFAPNRSWSGFWSGSHGSPSTPKSETAGSDEIIRQGNHFAGPVSQPDRSETPLSRPSQRKSVNGSRMSAFFRSSSTTNNVPPQNPNVVDLLGEGGRQPDWDWNRQAQDGGVQVLPDPVPDSLGAVSKDLWEGVGQFYSFDFPKFIYGCCANLEMQILASELPDGQYLPLLNHSKIQHHGRRT